MCKITVSIFSLAAFSLVFLSSLTTPAFSQEPNPSADYVSAARDLLWTARAGRDQAQQMCQEPDACSSSFLSQLGQLQAAIANLESLLGQSSPDLESIRNSINTLASLVQTICNQLGTCAAPPAGADADPADDPQVISTLGVTCRQCDEDYRTCQREAARVHDPCTQYYDNAIGCLARVPFCDGSAPYPFDRQLFASQCQRYIDAQLIPACRCACDWTERQGGCPEFFQTGTSCATCPNQMCSTIPGSCSCRRESDDVPKMRWNYTQCDVCRWSAIGYSVNNLNKNFFCDKPYTERLARCGAEHRDCRRSCCPLPGIICALDRPATPIGPSAADVFLSPLGRGARRV